MATDKAIKRFPDGKPKPYLSPTEYAELRDDDRFLYNEGPATPPPASADALGEVERVARAIERELDVQELVLTDPITLRRLKAKRIATAALSAMSPAGEVEKIVAWLRSNASIEHRHGPAITRDAFMRDIADAIERGDYRHD